MIAFTPIDNFKSQNNTDVVSFQEDFSARRRAVAAKWTTSVEKVELERPE
jgi:hypothetical protein